MVARKKGVTQIHNLKFDDHAHEIFEYWREAMKQQGISNISSSTIMRHIDLEAKLGQKLCNKLMAFAGESGKNEGAEDVIERLLKELIELRSKFLPCL